MKSSVVTTIALGEPVGASVLAYVFLGQVPTVFELIIISIILSSVFIVVHSEIREVQFSAISSYK